MAGPDPGPDPDEALALAIADRVEAKRRAGRVRAAEVDVEKAGIVLAERRDVLAGEETDVERLERLSWTRVVAGLRGTHATDLDRERAERDAARYAVREAEVRLQQAESELVAARAALAELGDVEQRYRAALDAKEQWMAAHAPEVAARLGEIAERRGALEAERREIKEADDAGVTAHKILEKADKSLRSAESWSGWDTFMGGGLLTDWVKHSRLDEVRELLVLADRALARLGQELADLNREAIAGIRFSPALSLFDVVFDNIFSDWRVLRRIQDAEEQVRRTAAQIRGVVTSLRARRDEVAAELASLSEERERLLVPSGRVKPR